MQNYELQKLNSSIYSYLILSKNYINPLEEIKDIELSLKGNNQIKIMFDLLLSNGNTSNRFIEATYDGENLKDFKLCEDVDNSIRSLSKRFYISNINLLENSVLNKSQQTLIKQGKLN